MQQLIDKETEDKALEHLMRIEDDLEEIKERTPGSKRSFINGIWQGVGVVAGSILAFILLGWLLSIFGLIPGFGVITESIQNAVAQWHGR